MRLSEKITLLRKRRGLSQEQLANELDVSRQAIYKWETGQTTPEIEKVKKLSDIFHVSLSDLLNDNVDIEEVPIIISNNEEADDREIKADAPQEDEGQADAHMEAPSKRSKKKFIILFTLLCSVSLIAIALGIILAIVFNEKEPQPSVEPPEPSHTCVFGAYEIEVEPSCSKAGLERRYCQYCDEVESRAIATIPHSEIIVHGYAATCSAGGLSNGKKCSNCNTVLAEQKATSVDPNNHKEETVYGYASTCTVQGLSDGKKCADCDKVLVEQERLPLATHKAEATLGFAPTCTKAGLTDGSVCSVCDAVLEAQSIIDVNPDAHTRIAVDGKAPTCIEKGLTEGVKCAECNKILQGQAEIDFTEHTVEIINGYDATCLNDGLTEGKRCSYCKVILVNQQVIASNGQHVKETIEGYASTCTTAGKSDGVKCTECGEILTEQKDLELSPHTETVTPGYEATCTSTGLKDKIVCSICDYVISDGELIPTLEHSYTDGRCTVCQNPEPNLTLDDFSVKLNEDNKSYSLYYIGTLTNIDTLIIPSTYKGLPITRIEKVDETKNATSVIIPNTVTYIEGAALSQESNLKRIYIPNSVAYVGNSLLGSMISFTKTVIFCQNGIDKSGWDDEWNAFQSIVLHVNSDADIVSSFGDAELIFSVNDDGASYSVSGNEKAWVTTNLVIPSEYNGLPVTQILPYAFNGNTVVEKVFIPSSVKRIHACAFENCSNLKNVTISEGVEEIISCAFANTAIKTVYIPKTVTTMGVAIFDGCNNMKNIFCSGESSEWHWYWDGNGEGSHECIRSGYSAMGCTDEGFSWVQKGKEIYIIDYCGSEQSITIPTSVNSMPVTQIFDYAFQDNAVVEEALIPDSIKKVGNYAFDGCANLKKVTVSTGVEYIGNEAFSETTIESIFIPNTVAQLGAAVFDGCNELQNIYCQLESQPSEWSALWLYHGDTNHECVTWGVLENPIE